MSLGVHVYFIDESGQEQWLRSVDWKSAEELWKAQGLTTEEKHPEISRLRVEHELWRNLAGPERWQTEMYGSPVARSLGLTLLPSLSEQDIYAQGEDLDVLGREIETPIQNIGLLVSDRQDQWESVLFDFRNIANAVTEAKSLNGTVVIW